MVHETAQVDNNVRLGKDVKIWNWVQIRKNASIGDNTIISKSVYVDFDVIIGRNVKVQNNVSIFHGVVIEDGVCIGPHVCFTNDKIPRAINLDGSLKKNHDWKVSRTLVKYGSSLGANSTILSGITIGRYAMVGAGAVVTKDIPDYGLVVGVPARLIGYVCECGNRLDKNNNCINCNKIINIGKEVAI